MNKRRKINQVCDNCPRLSGVSRDAGCVAEVRSWPRCALSLVAAGSVDGGCWESLGSALEAACEVRMTRMSNSVRHVEEMEISIAVKLVWPKTSTHYFLAPIITGTPFCDSSRASQATPSNLTLALHRFCS